MEPVAKRTRRRTEEALLEEYRERKKSKTCSDRKPEVIVLTASPSPSLGSSGSSSESDSESESSAHSVSASRSPVLGNVKKEEFEEEDTVYVPEKPVSGSSSPIVIPGSSESDEEDSADSVSSDYGSDSDSAAEEENGESSSEGEGEGGVKTKYASAESGSSYKISSLGSINRPIVLDGDEDDDDEADGSGSSGGSVEDYGVVDRPDVLNGDDDDEIDGSGSSGCAKDLGVVDDAQTCSQKKHIVDDEEEEEEVEEEEEEQLWDEEEEVVVKKEKHIADVDDEEEDEEEEVAAKKEKLKMPQSKITVRRGPMTADEIHRVLFNSILEEANKDVVEEEVKKPHEVEETRSRSSSSSSDVDSEEEKDPQQEEIESVYRMMNFYLANADNGAAEACLADDHTGKTQEQLCNQGEHYLILDEEIGVICKVCGHVREEIKHVMPPFHDNPFGYSDRSGYYTYDHQDPKNLPYFEDPNIDPQHFKEDADIDTSGTVWEISPGIRGTLYPHQREAFEFIWRHVGGGTKLDELLGDQGSDGGGCLISHAPGTGKTRLSIAFLETYMKLFKNSRPVVLAPASILLSWKQEFERWKVEAPFLNLNEKELSHQEMCFATSLFGRSYEKNLTQTAKRLIKLLFWKRHESVLAISYTLFTQLAAKDVKKQEMLRELLLEKPGILILDEAHMPRNERSLMFKVLKEVKTKKRILLSGTPFQNNFRELHNILCLVRKEFNDEINPFNKSGFDKAHEGRIRELKEKLKTFCHCCDSRTLTAMLDGLVDNNIYLQPSEHQKRLLKQEEERTKNHLEANVNMALISVHPLLLHCKDTNPDFTQELKSERWDLADGAKTRFLIRLIQLSSALEERVLVFSQYLHPLNFLKALLQSHRFGWREGIEVHLMSGSQEMETRKRAMDLFNKRGSPAKVMLASTKACSEGIELTGASRVVLLDVTWNPSVEKQAISRAFRMGQKRVVHVYHLIMTDSDSNMHLSQSQKNNFSNYIFSSNNNNTHDAPHSSKPACEDVILQRLREENIIQEATQETTFDRPNRF